MRLNAEDLHEARSLRETTGMNDSELGAIFGVASDAIGRALGTTESDRESNICPTGLNPSRG